MSSSSNVNNIPSNSHSLLHLDLSHPSQAFKRSFQQYGFDTENLANSGSGSSDLSSPNNGERNKRPRSEGFVSATSEASSSGSNSPRSGHTSSTSSLSSSSSSVYHTGVDDDVNGLPLLNQAVSSYSSGLSLSRPEVLAGIPTPPIESRAPTSVPALDEDVTIIDAEESTSNTSSDTRNSAWYPSQTPNNPENNMLDTMDPPLRSSFERYREFDAHISALRRSPDPPTSALGSSIRLPPMSVYEDNMHDVPSSAPGAIWRDGPSRPLVPSVSQPRLDVDRSRGSPYVEGGLLRPERHSEVMESRDALDSRPTGFESIESARRFPQPPPSEFRMDSWRHSSGQVSSVSSFRPLQVRPPVPELLNPANMELPLDIQPPFLSVEEDTRSLRQHAESLLEDMQSRPILPLSFNSLRNDERGWRRQRLNPQATVTDNNNNRYSEPSVTSASDRSRQRHIGSRLQEPEASTEPDTNRQIPPQFLRHMHHAPLDENSEFARYRRAFHAPSRRLWDHLRDAAPHIRFPQLPPSNHESASLHWPPPQNDWHTEPRSQPQESRPQWASNGAFTRNEPVIDSAGIGRESVRSVNFLNEVLAREPLLDDDDDELRLGSRTRPALRLFDPETRQRPSPRFDATPRQPVRNNNSSNNDERSRFLPNAVRDVLARHDAAAHSRYRAYHSQLQQQSGQDNRDGQQNPDLTSFHGSNRPFSSHIPPLRDYATERESVLDTLRRAYSSPRVPASNSPDVPSDVPTSSEAAAYFASGSDSTLATSRSLDSLRQRRRDSIDSDVVRPSGAPPATGIDPYSISGLERSSNGENHDDITRTSLSVPRPSIFSMLNPPVRRPARPTVSQGSSTLWAPPSTERPAPPGEDADGNMFAYHVGQNGTRDRLIPPRPPARQNVSRESSRTIYEQLSRLRHRTEHAQDTSRGERDNGATRSPSLQQALNVMRGDGLSPARQQQFQAAYQHALEHARERTRNRWGEDAADNANNEFREALRHRRRTAALRLQRVAADNRDTSPSRLVDDTSPRRSPSPMEDNFHDVPSNAFRRTRNARMMQMREWDLPYEHFPMPSRFGRLPRRLRNLGRNMGDYMRDEDFDPSYENLIALAAALGDAKPRATPAHVIASLPTAFYKDWQNADSDTRCPICLDDYKALDPVLKLDTCDHWFHKECLEQWLHGARTCPVCRRKVRVTPGLSREAEEAVAGPSGTNNAENQEEDDDGSDNGMDFFPWHEFAMPRFY